VSTSATTTSTSRRSSDRPVVPQGAAIDPDGVADRLAVVRQRIESAGGDPAAVQVVAVTKGFGADAVVAAASAGLTTVGENYAQELVAKAATVQSSGTAIRWHFLGAVQRNKVPALAPLVDCWQTVARLAEGEAIGRRRSGADVLVEIDVSGAAGRNGCPPAAVPELVAGLAGAGVHVRGVMAVAPLGAPARPAFRAVRELADRLGLVERSMGMSDDLEDAVAEGATIVRIGRALFGDRPPR
jgi:pyridoxal phosphate enzyme (YggS family)